jgi:ribosome-associated toxin RatA of RatAB toxin-antitoxin module
MLALFLALFIAPPAQAFDASKVDGPTLERLAGTGQIVVVEEGPNGRLTLVTAGQKVNVPPEKVWALVTDYANYHKWMPQVDKVIASNRKGNTVDVFFDLDFQFSVISKEVTYSMRHIENPMTSIRWFLTEGDFSSSRGSWHLVPTDGGKATLIFYSTYTDLMSMGWIVASLLEEQPSMEMAIQASTAVMVVKAVKEAVE